MLESTFEALAQAQEKYPVLILLILLTGTLFMGYYAVDLQTDASFDSMFSPDGKVIQLKNLVSNDFGSTDTLFVLAIIDDSVNDRLRIQDIRDPQVLHALDALAKSLRKEESVSTVYSVVDILEQQGPLPQTLNEAKERFNQEMPLVSRDYTAANMIVSVDIANKPGSLERTQEAIQERIDAAEKPVGVSFILTGQPVLMNRIMNLLINDNLITIGIALIFVFIILWGFFRSLRMAFVTLQPVLVTLIWLAGTLTLLDIRINMMIAAVGAMMVGMGVDYSIHMTHAFHEKVREGKKNVTKETVRGVGGALVASALTTVAGFIAMLFGSSPSSQIQGTVLAIGIVYAFLSTLLVLPCILVIQRTFMYAHIDEILFKIRPKKKTSSTITKALTSFAKLQANHPKAVLTGVGIFTLLLIPGMTLVWIDTDNANWIPEGDTTIESFNTIRDYFGSTESMNLLVMLDPEAPEGSIRDLRDPLILEKVAILDAFLEELTFVNSVQSPTDTLQRIPKDIAQVKKVVDTSAYNADFSVLKLNIISDGWGNPENGEEEINFYQIVNEIESVQFPEGIVVEPQGGVADFVEMQASLGSDVGKTTIIGFIFVITIASLLYSSVVVGMLSFFPVIFAIIWSVAIMGYTNLPFTPLTSGLLAIVMGMGIDFSIHLVHKTKESLEEYDIENALIASITSTGEAIFASTVTTVVGFMSLLLASLLVTQRLGLTLAIAIGCCFIACMLIVPAVLTIQHTLGGAK